jgi:signal transduction histidine kinase
MVKPPDDFTAEIGSVSQIPAVSTILEVICRTTGMGFAALARVTEERWIACSVLDSIDFGLQPGGELKIETTICQEIRQSREPVVIDNVAEDARWCRHHTPAAYGFQSYISVPVILEDGSFFGTLCAIDPHPAHVNRPEIIDMFRLFAQLIAKHLDTRSELTATEAALAEERKTGELREQFMAVLGHDLRNPLRGVRAFAELLLRRPLDQQASEYAGLILDSAMRMQSLIDNLLDLARGELRGGLSLEREATTDLEPTLRGIVAECIAAHPDRVVATKFSLLQPITCNVSRMAQLFTNLLSNALTHGSGDKAVTVEAVTHDGLLELSVANAGEPIPEAALEHLFRPFYRNTVRSDREGLGLGLYIAHAIATAHGGSLTVQSDEDETRFTFRMPLECETASLRSPAAHSRLIPIHPGTEHTIEPNGSLLDR